MNKNTPNYKENLIKVSEEMKIRNDIGLTNNTNEDYLKILENKFPNEYEFISNLNKQLPKGFIDNTTQLVINIPVAGFQNQEKENIRRTIKLLTEQELFIGGNVKILIFSNRPELTDGDNTKEEIQKYLEYLGIKDELIGIIESDIPKNLGRIDGPFYEEMATNDNQVPIGFIRDVMNIIIAMQASGKDLPILQMDGDFYGFRNGGLKNIVDSFSKKNCNFLQCKSDWEGNVKTNDIPLLKFGSDLMSELPMILKDKINKNISYKSKEEIVFSDGIQRGIQVPQVELLSQIIKKGGYGLLRLSCDELDLNIRSAFTSQPDGLKSTGDVTFLRDNRRAIATLFQYNIPPISQRENGFEADDKVRGKQNLDIDSIKFTSENLLNTLNLTLEKFVIPEKIDGVYDDGEQEILKKLERLGINCKYGKIVEREGGFVKLQINYISNGNFNELRGRYNGK